MANIWAIPLALTGFNIVLAVLGGFVCLFGLVSHLVKEDLYLSEALVSLLAGVVLGPNAANLIRPSEYAYPDPCSSSSSPSSSSSGAGPVSGPDPSCPRGYFDSLDAATLAFSRLVLGVQLVIAGTQLPARYLRAQWRPLALLLGPGMACMWLATSLLIWALARPPSVLHALAIGACVTPTDPVLSAVVVRGRFAEKHVPRALQDLIVAESGANDGLGYPFLFLALYLIKYLGAESAGAPAPAAGRAVGLWFAMALGWVVLLSVAYGAAVGWLARRALGAARRRGLVDRESTLVFAVSMALFVIGTCGLIGTDDVLASFIAGNAYAWADKDEPGPGPGPDADADAAADTLHPAVDTLLNLVVFAWYGAVIPWGAFSGNEGHGAALSTGRLVALGVLVMLLRRLPWILCMQRLIPQIRGPRDALFAGFFGPIGVSAVFYLLVTLQFIDEHLSDGEGTPRGDVEHLGETVRVVVWFITVCSIAVHGLSIPLGNLALLAYRAVGRFARSVDGGWGGLGSRVPTISRLFEVPKSPTGEAPSPAGVGDGGERGIVGPRPQ